MVSPVFQKIYIMLGKSDKENLKRICSVLPFLFSHSNMTSSLYIVMENLPESMPQVKTIHKEINKFLSEFLFVRLFVHYVHYVSAKSLEETGFCYQYIKQMTGDFDKEGYMYQELPRLMLLPVIAPDSQIKAFPFINFLDRLRKSFFLSSLYLDQTALSFAQDEKIQSLTEKNYFGSGNSGSLQDIMTSMFYQDLLDNSLNIIDSSDMNLNVQCPACLIISAQDGRIYSCMDAFQKGEKLANIDEDLDIDKLMSRGMLIDRSGKNCLDCRERAAESFSDSPMSRDTMQKLGALLCHFGILHQNDEDYLKAIKRYEQSLNISPIEEAGRIYFRLGFCHTNIGHYDYALKSFASAEVACSGEYYFYFYKGVCYFGKGDYHTALQEFLHAINLNPQQDDLIRILIYAGSCHNNIGEYEKAVILLEKAEKLAGRVKEIYNALGFSYFKLKNYDKSIQNLLIAIDIDPCSAMDFASLGSNYREKGDFEKAIVMYEKALEMDPDMTVAMENLKKLEKRV